MQPQELIRSSRLRISTSYWPPLAERARNAPKKPHCGSSATTSIPSVRPRQRRSEISSSSLVSQPGDDFRSSTALALAPRFDLPGAGAGFEAALSGIRRRVLLYGESIGGDYPAGAWSAAMGIAPSYTGVWRDRVWSDGGSS